MTQDSATTDHSVPADGGTAMTLTPSPLVVVVGSINADLVVQTTRHPAPGETVLGHGLTMSPGGKGANQAVAAARLGTSTAFVGAVGPDEYADTALSGLIGAGVDLKAVTRLSGKSEVGTGVAVVTVAADGDNSIVVVPGANQSVDRAAVLEARSLIEAADIVVLQGEIPRDGIETAAELARGRLIVNLAPVIEVDRSVLLKSDPLVVNEHEAAEADVMLGGSTALTVTVSDGEEPESAIARSLIAQGIRSVVLTLGSRGALVAVGGSSSSGREIEVLAIPAACVVAVDTTGAGDAFVGAIASRLADGDDLATAARLASRVSAFAVQGRGAQPSYPDASSELPLLPTETDHRAGLPTH